MSDSNEITMSDILQMVRDEIGQAINVSGGAILSPHSPSDLALISIAGDMKKLVADSISEDELVSFFDECALKSSVEMAKEMLSRYSIRKR